MEKLSDTDGNSNSAVNTSNAAMGGKALMPAGSAWAMAIGAAGVVVGAGRILA
jgi:hypothetical protein